MVIVKVYKSSQVMLVLPIFLNKLFVMLPQYGSENLLDHSAFGLYPVRGCFDSFVEDYFKLLWTFKAIVVQRVRQDIFGG